jgi:hypothetical protein
VFFLPFLLMLLHTLRIPSMPPTTLITQSQGKG